MALLNVSFFSKYLKRSVEYTVYLPSDEYNYMTIEKMSKHPYKSLYLLHGIFGFRNDWVTHSRLLSYVKGANLAVIMPSGENSFYVDNNVSGSMYEHYFFEELVEETRNIFPLSTKKEDTFIAGLSMGGFGALRNGFVHNDIFSCIGAFSSGLPIDDKTIFPNDVYDLKYSYLHKDKAEDFKIYDIVEKNKDQAPRLLIGCGRQDFLYEANKNFIKHLDKLGIKYDYFEAEGAHDWDFWDLSIKKFIDYIKD